MIVCFAPALPYKGKFFMLHISAFMPVPKIVNNFVIFADLENGYLLELAGV